MVPSGVNGGGHGRLGVRRWVKPPVNRTLRDLVVADKQLLKGRGAALLFVACQNREGGDDSLGKCWLCASCCAPDVKWKSPVWFTPVAFNVPSEHLRAPYQTRSRLVRA